MSRDDQSQNEDTRSADFHALAADSLGEQEEILRDLLENTQLSPFLFRAKLAQIRNSFQSLKREDKFFEIINYRLKTKIDALREQNEFSVGDQTEIQRRLNILFLAELSDAYVEISNSTGLVLYSNLATLATAAIATDTTMDATTRLLSANVHLPHRALCCGTIAIITAIVSMITATMYATGTSITGDATADLALVIIPILATLVLGTATIHQACAASQYKNLFQLYRQLGGDTTAAGLEGWLRRIGDQHIPPARHAYDPETGTGTTIATHSAIAAGTQQPTGGQGESDIEMAVVVSTATTV